MLNLLNKHSDTLPLIERELLLSHAAKCPRIALYKDTVPKSTAWALYESLVERRLEGEPLQYLIGSTEFMGLDFIVNKHVLIPRPETEILVSELLDRASHHTLPINILEVCTGSGNIAVSIAHALDKANITATDISLPALEVAKENAKKHHVGGKISFYSGDLFQALPLDKTNKFDIIVCNPPYVKTAELETLQEELKHEPLASLDGGRDGLEFYTRIAQEAPMYLKKGGDIFLEIGIHQAKSVMDLFKNYKIRKIKKDFAGIDRIIWISLL